MSDPRFKGALADKTVKAGSIGLEAIDDRGMIDLRGLAGDTEFFKAASKALGFDLPTNPRSSAGKGETTALWMSVDQWLITCPRTGTTELVEVLGKALDGIHAMCTDVSDARSIIRLTGNSARHVLMKGAPVDLTTDEYVKGYVRRLRFAELAAMVHIVSEDEDVLDLYVFRSYASYVWDWLVETSRGSSRIQLFGKQSPAST